MPDVFLRIARNVGADIRLAGEVTTKVRRAKDALNGIANAEDN